MIAAVLSVAVIVGFVSFFFTRDVALMSLALSCLFYSALMAATFRAIDRFTIPQVLPAILALAIPLSRLGMRRASNLLLAILLVASIVRVPGNVTRFEALHPIAENEAVLAMQADIGAPVRALVRPFFSLGGTDPWHELRRLLDAHDNEFLVLARSTSAPAIQQLLSKPPGPGFAVLRNDDLLVIDASVTESPWLDSAAAVPRGEVLEMRIDIRTADAQNPILMAAFLLGTKLNSSFEWQHIPLAATGDRSFTGSLPLDKLRGVTCRFVPAVILSSGIIRRGAPFELTL